MDHSSFAPPSPHHDDHLPEHTHKDALNTRTPASALTPPSSEDMDTKPPGNHDNSSDLSDLEDDLSDIDEIKPDHYYEGGKIPVFKPVCILML